MQIEVIAGSPRKKSVTRRLALHLVTALQQRTNHSVHLTDLSATPMPMMQRVFANPAEAPEELQPLAGRMLQADAFVLVTPEYNGSYAPALQNLFDHFPKQHHKAFALATASPGALGGIRAAMHLQQFCLALFGIPSPYMLVTPQVDKKFDESGQLLDPQFEKSIAVFLKEFLWLAENLVPKNQLAHAGY